MGKQGRNDPATDRALALVEGGSSVHGAAIKEGISPSTLFRARKRMKGGKAKGASKRRTPAHYEMLAAMKRKKDKK